MQQKLDINPQFKKALKVMENSSENIFITGRAGTGKSTLLEHFRNKTKKNIAVLAPTGVAAVNIKGQTIHSFFGFKPDITVKKVRQQYKNRKKQGLYKKLEAIVIDEISMVRADLFDCVDQFMRLNGKNKHLPFGGAQIILFGDLYQLSPVVTGEERQIFTSVYKSHYFFDAHVFADLKIEFVELQRIYRQSDQGFIDILNGVRNRSITASHFQKLNQRLDPNFQLPNNQLFIYLTTTNKKAQEVNRKNLAKIKEKPFIFKGSLTGSFQKRALPTLIDLKLKVGAQIMLVNNDARKRWINGTIGKIINVKYIKEKQAEAIVIKLENKKIVEVFPHVWEMFRFSFNKDNGRIESETTGSFSQYPLMLAWAITIHKSQGKTFKKAIIDIGQGAFAHGQTYVALSRCTSLEGIILKKPIEKKHLLLDWRVVKFLSDLQYKKAQELLSNEERIAIIKEAIVNKTRLKITYLKPNDEKSLREVQPRSIGKMEYREVKYLGFKAYCFKRQDERVFRVDRILKIKKINP